MISNFPPLPDLIISILILCDGGRLYVMDNGITKTLATEEEVKTALAFAPYFRHKVVAKYAAQPKESCT